MEPCFSTSSTHCPMSRPIKSPPAKSPSPHVIVALALRLCAAAVAALGMPDLMKLADWKLSIDCCVSVFAAAYRCGLLSTAFTLAAVAMSTTALSTPTGALTGSAPGVVDKTGGKFEILEAFARLQREVRGTASAGWLGLLRGSHGVWKAGRGRGRCG